MKQPRGFFLSALFISLALVGGYHFGRWNKSPDIYIVPIPIPCKCNSVNI